jgi:hypothetical protein
MRAAFSWLSSAHALLLLLSLLALVGVLIGVTLIDGWVAQAAMVAISVLLPLLGVKATA